MPRLIANQSGITVIEVLIAAVIFMVGFSTLILLMNNTLVRFSAKELLQADNLAHELMTVSVADRDITVLDTVVVRSGVAFRAVRRITISDRLAGVTISIYRNKQDRKILELYNAFVIRGQ